jgi:hypothetical protein
MSPSDYIPLGGVAHSGRLSWRPLSSAPLWPPSAAPWWLQAYARHQHPTNDPQPGRCVVAPAIGRATHAVQSSAKPLDLLSLGR